MKPEGNRVGNWTGRNARPQGLIGSEEKAKADSSAGLLPERSLGGERAAREFRREDKEFNQEEARQGSQRAENTPRMAQAMN